MGSIITFDHRDRDLYPVQSTKSPLNHDVLSQSIDPVHHEAPGQGIEANIPGGPWMSYHERCGGPPRGHDQNLLIGTSAD